MNEWMRDGPKLLADGYIVDRVKITNRSPRVDNDRGADVFEWWFEMPDNLYELDWLLPKEFALKKFYYWQEIEQFDTRRQALDWLSDKCINWAKEESNVS